MSEGTWVIETTYNTDPEGKWVEYDDWTNRTLHGPFATEEEGMAFMQDFQADDTDVKEMLLIYVNPLPVEES